jgi:hypothetical protein
MILQRCVYNIYVNFSGSYGSLALLPTLNPGSHMPLIKVKADFTGSD